VTPAVLVAPIAGEISINELALLASVPFRAAILQGWLRTLEEGAEVRSLPLQALGAAATQALGRFHHLVASREDLLAESRDAREQLNALRRVFGDGPALVVTAGADGLWLDDRTATHHLPVPRLVDAASTVGAGDVLAA